MINNSTYRKLVRYWLVGVLLFFPFIKVVNSYLIKNKYAQFVYVVRFLDEITIAILFPFAVRELYRKKEIFNRSYLIIAIPIIIFSVFGLISGIVNENSLKITLLGTIDYVKYFLIIFIYAAFFRRYDDFKLVFRPLLLLAVIISIGAIVEEIWALISRYIIGKDILDPLVYLFRPPSSNISVWRFGILRASSIIQKVDWVGYFCLFVFTVYSFSNNKINNFIKILLPGAILVTVSRSAFAGLCFLILFFLVQKSNSKKMIMAFVVLIIVLIPVMSVMLPDIDLLAIDNNDLITYREFVRLKAGEIWGNYPVIGIGPGMFGGPIANIFGSPIYYIYDFPFLYIESFGGIDQFWPQLYVETGIIGVFLFVAIILALIKTLLYLKKFVAIDNDVKNLLTGLLTFLMIIYIYTFSTGFTTAAVVFAYFAFVGICVGAVNELSHINGVLENDFNRINRNSMK